MLQAHQDASPKYPKWGADCKLLGIRDKIK